MDFHDFSRFLGKSGCRSHPPPPKLCAGLVSALLCEHAMRGPVCFRASPNWLPFKLKLRCVISAPKKSEGTVSKYSRWWRLTSIRTSSAYDISYVTRAAAGVQPSPGSAPKVRCLLVPRAEEPRRRSGSQQKWIVEKNVYPKDYTIRFMSVYRYVQFTRIYCLFMVV